MAEKGDAKGAASGRNLTLPRDFTNELRAMMYGFGDESEPRLDSIKLMEEMVLEYITGLIGKCTEVANMQRRERPDVTDLKFVIRKNPRQLKRVRYLLEMKAVITKATKVDAEEVAHAGPV